MKVTVDKKVCIGCGLCTSLAENVFEMKGDKSQVKKDVDLTTPKNQKEATEAKEACCVGAIVVTT